MPAHIGTLLAIDDHEKFGEYARAVALTLAKYGGRVARRDRSSTWWREAWT